MRDLEDILADSRTHCLNPTDETHKEVSEWLHRRLTEGGLTPEEALTIEGVIHWHGWNQGWKRGWKSANQRKEAQS